MQHNHDKPAQPATVSTSHAYVINIAASQATVHNLQLVYARGWGCSRPQLSHHDHSSSYLQFEDEVCM